MNRVVVIGFEGEAEALEALASLRSLEKQGYIAFEDTAVVTHHADGRMDVKGEASAATEAGAVVGGLLGGLVTVLFPIAGIALGAAAGAGLGAVLGTGVDGTFVKEVQAELPPGRSALFLVVRQANADVVIASLRGFRGQVIQTTLDEETEQALRSALGG